MRKPDGWPVLVASLRDASAGIEEAARQTEDMGFYFPPREEDEMQPVFLQGYVPLSRLAGLVSYIADMLER